MLREWARGGLVGLDAALVDVVAVAAVHQRSALLIGRHGSGKTTLAANAAKLAGGAFVHYDAVHDDLISVAGVPSPRDLAEGRLRFAEHDRTIWNKSVVLIDELTRAPPETSNLWLSIVAERCLHGRQLPLRVLFAAANPDSYANALELDPALVDRMAYVVRLPEPGALSLEVLEAQARANLASPPPAGPRDLPDARGRLLGVLALHAARLAAMQAVRAQRDRLARNPVVVARVAEWAALVTREILRVTSKYVSPRTYALFLPNALLDFWAYLQCEHLGGVREASRLALSFAVGQKLDLPSEVIAAALEAGRPALRAIEGALHVRDAEAVVRGLAEGTLPERVAVLCTLLARHDDPSSPVRDAIALGVVDLAARCLADLDRELPRCLDPDNSPDPIAAAIALCNGGSPAARLHEVLSKPASMDARLRRVAEDLSVVLTMARVRIASDRALRCPSSPNGRPSAVAPRVGVP